MKAKEWLDVIKQARDYNPEMTPLIEQYGKMLLSEHAPDSKTLEACKDEVARKHGYGHWGWFMGDFVISTDAEDIMDEVAELYSLSRKEEWVSVLDEKPDWRKGIKHNAIHRSVRVFVFDRQYGVQRAEAFILMKDFDGRKRGSIEYYGQSIAYQKVTHFMYDILPIPPKS